MTEQTNLIVQIVNTMNAIMRMLTGAGIDFEASWNRQGWPQITPVAESPNEWPPKDTGGFNIAFKDVGGEMAIDILLSPPGGPTEYYSSHRRSVPLRVFHFDEYAEVTQWAKDDDLAQWDGATGDGLARIVEEFGNVEHGAITDRPTLREENLTPARTYTVTHAVRKHGDDRARAVYEIMRGELIVDADGNGAAFDTGTARVVAVETTSEMFPHDTLNMARKHATAEAPAFEWRYYVEMYQVARRCREIALQSYVDDGIEAPDYLNAWLEQQEDTELCQ